MVADLSYIHVTMPSNISTLYQQADVFKNYLTDLANFTTSKMHRIPFTEGSQRCWTNKTPVFKAKLSPT